MKIRIKFNKQIQVAIFTTPPKNVKDFIRVFGRKRGSKTIFSLSSAQWGNLCPLFVENAKSHLELAERLFKNREYGFSVAHTVLASEEMVKALIVFGEGLGLGLRKQPGLKKYFSDHKVRHHLTNQFFLTVCFLLPFTKVFKEGESLIEWNEDGSVKNTWCQENRIKFLRYLVPLRRALNWWSNAEYYKQRGFYVDYVDRPLLPKDIALKECEIGLEVTIQFFDACYEFIGNVEKMSEVERKKYRDQLIKMNIGEFVAAHVKPEERKLNSLQQIGRQIHNVSQWFRKVRVK